MTLAAILSLSLVVNLPGLAVTPMLSTLSKVFPGTTQIEKQLLTILPNLLIIPFVLLSGKLSMTKHKRATIFWALVIFTASAVGYLFSKSMLWLIILSCTLGCGAGLLIPFSTGLLADTFMGKYRMRMMGVQSGVSNLALVIATYVVGWLSGDNWHLPFLVYLVSVIPLIFSFKLDGIPQQDLTNPDAGQQADNTEYPALPNEKVKNGFYINRILQIVGVYLFITFAVMVISYYSPFMVQKYHWSDSLTGTLTSLFFLFILLPGFFLARLVRIFKGWTFIIASAFMLGGIAMFGLIHAKWALCVGSSLAGLGYGMCQPMIYDKASRTVDTTAKATMALAIVLSSNYISLVITPFIVDLFRNIFHAGHVPAFPFYFSAILLAVYFVITLWKRNSFAFGVDKSYYK